MCTTTEMRKIIKAIQLNYCSEFVLMKSTHPLRLAIVPSLTFEVKAMPV